MSISYQPAVLISIQLLTTIKTLESTGTFHRFNAVVANRPNPSGSEAVPSNMSAKPCEAKWADEPYALISTAQVNNEKGAHAANRAAREMIGAHNVFIRGLNSIVLQGPHVPKPGSEDFNWEDLQDFLHYVGAWERLIEHHHNAEERVLFPELALLSDAVKMLVEAPVEEHAAFHDGLVALRNYVEKCSQDLNSYRWEVLNGLVNAVAPSLMEHLYSEPDMLLGLESDCSSDAVEKCMAATEKAAINETTLDFLYNTFPIVLGTADKTYEGGNTFPPLPWHLKFALKWWFSRRNQGAWRFCPSDWESRPRPLVFLP